MAALAKSRISAEIPFETFLNNKRKYPRKSENKPKSVNQLEQRRALRQVQHLHKSLKMPVPQLPAVLSYLRWLDKMETWTGKSHPSSVNRISDEVREAQMYSWSGNFGNPIALPNIKKYSNSEKYSSAQFKERVYGNETPSSARKVRSHTAREYYTDPSSKKNADKNTVRDFSSRNSLESRKKTQSASPRLGSGVRYNGKPTPFYIHAKEGFQYWPKEIYTPPVPPTKYSFGDRFNPGRIGVITDRIYARPRSNKHYWTEFQMRQNPIGSGNAVTGTVLNN